MPSLPQPPPSHPRLFITNGQIDSLKNQIKSDPVSRKIFQCIQRRADQFLDATPPAYKLEGIRLLHQSRLCLEHVLALSMAALLTGDRRYADRAIHEMELAAAFPDWNPSHFLDTAEMTLGLAIGYDWLFDRLTDSQRRKIATAILEKGIKPSFKEWTSNEWWTWWVTGTNNWTQVCHAGMTAGALALAEDEPELAERMINRAAENVPRSAAAYAPDGAYAEGPMYWSYGTSFHVALIAMLETWPGKDFGLADSPGFLESGEYILQMTAPGGSFYNYADCRTTRCMEGPLFWFARRLDNPALLQADLPMLDELLTTAETGKFDRLLPLALLWWKPEFASATGPCVLPLHWTAKGPNPVSVHRSAWNDENAVFAAIKGGSPSGPHAHKDAGSFILEAGGVRWVIDPGLEEYHPLESAGVDLWNMKDGSQRWEIFRLGTQGHSVLRFNGAQQLSAGKASITQFQAGGTMPHTVVDLASIYEDQVANVSRGLALYKDGTVLLQDEWIAGDTPVTTRWQIITAAEATVEGTEVILSQAGRRLKMKVLKPAVVKIEVIDVSKPPLPYDTENPHTSAIAFECRTEAGRSGLIRVVFSLPDAQGEDTDAPPRKTLAEWPEPSV